MSKTTQSMNLSHWFSIDRILFGKTNPKSVLTDSEFKCYVTAKGAALSNLYEMFRVIGYTPNEKFETVEEMRKFAFKQSDDAKVRAKKILTTESVASEIRKEISQAEISEGVTSEDVAKIIVDHKVKTVALDLVMVESALEATGNKGKLSTWTGNVMLDSYKTLRDALVKYAY